MVYKYIELINTMIQVDLAIKPFTKGGMARDHMVRPGLVQYFIQLFTFFKGEPALKKQLLTYFWNVLLHYRISDHE